MHERSMQTHAQINFQLRQRMQPMTKAHCIRQSILFHKVLPRGGGGGGGQKTKWKIPSPNFEELIESITNMLLFFSEVSRKKRYEVSKLGGEEGGFGLKEKFITFLNYYFLEL